MLFLVNGLSDSDKLRVLSDGFFNDILLTTFSDLGIPLDKPYKLGYVTSSVSYFIYFPFIM